MARKYARRTRVPAYVRDSLKLQRYNRRIAGYQAGRTAFEGGLVSDPRGALYNLKHGIVTGGAGLYTGHGSYRKTRSTIGRALGSRTGKNFGNLLLSKAYKQLNGMGGYGPTMVPVVNSNIQSGKGIADTVPSFHSAGDETGALTVCHREYITDVFCPTLASGQTLPFLNQSYQINPGLEASFPWLSQIAQNYDEYELSQLVYTFRSTTTDIGTSTNGQCGTLVMATNYNAAQPAFSDKVTMMEYDAARSCKISESMLHGVECDPSKRSGPMGMYVRSGPLPVNQDIKTYDHGKFQFAIVNVPSAFSNQSLGEVWVSYTVKLRKPKFFTNRGLGIQREVYANNATQAGGDWTPNYNTETYGPLGPSFVSAQQNNIGGLMYNGVTADTNILTSGVATDTLGCNVYLFPAETVGNFRVTLRQAAPADGDLTLGTSMTLYGNISTWKDLYGKSTTSPYPPGSNTQVINQPTTQATTTTGEAGYSSSLISIWDIAIQSASNGQSNAFTLTPGSNTTLCDCSVEIIMINPVLSTSESNASIVFVNSAGTVVTTMG